MQWIVNLCVVQYKELVNKNTTKIVHTPLLGLLFVLYMDKKRLKNRMRQFKCHYFEIRVEYMLCTIVYLALSPIAASLFCIGRLSTFSQLLFNFFNRWRRNPSVMCGFI